MIPDTRARRTRGSSLAVLLGCFFLFTLLHVRLLPASAQSTTVEALDRYIAQAQQTWPVPGLAIAIVKDGEVLLSKGYGVRELGGTDPVDEHTLFAIASNTKAFTAASLAMLVDDEKLTWDDYVADHLPFFRLYDEYATTEIRVRDLLTHRAGFRNYSGDLVWYGTPYSPEEVLQRARYLKPAYAFRTKYGYSNVMYVAAGEVVARVSGRPFNRFVREEILDPLGMTRTTLEEDDFAQLGNVATPHRERDGETVRLDWFEWVAADAAGGIVSSAHDMSRWVRLQLGRGEWNRVRLFSEARCREMWSPETIIPLSASTRQQYPSTHFRSYGLGWVLQDYHGRMVVTHGGGYDGMFSRVAMVPEENLGLVVLTNAMTSITNVVTYRILDAFLGAEPRDWSSELLPQYLEDRAAFQNRQNAVFEVTGDLTSANPSRALIDYTGRFRDQMYGDFTVTLERDALVLQALPFPDLVADLQHLHTDTFRLTWRDDFAWFDGGVVQFLTATDGRITGLRIEIPNEDFWFDELHPAKVMGSGSPEP